MSAVALQPLDRQPNAWLAILRAGLLAGVPSALARDGDPGGAAGDRRRQCRVGGAMKSGDADDAN